jgi:dihydrofolate reductase
MSDRVKSAVAQARTLAGDRTVGVVGSNIAQQCLSAGLLDEVRFDLVPVLLGDGIGFFDVFASGPVMLDNPTVVEGNRGTHLRYRVSGRSRDN